MVSLPSVDIVTFSLPQAATTQTTIKGFIHGKKIRHNAMLGYFPDPASDDGHWKVQWQPIPGYYWRHDLIKGFLTESSLLPDDQNEKLFVLIRWEIAGNFNQAPLHRRPRSPKFQRRIIFNLRQREGHVAHVMPGILVRLPPRPGANSRFSHHRRLAHPCRLTPHLQHVCLRLRKPKNLPRA